MTLGIAVALVAGIACAGCAWGTPESSTADQEIVDWSDEVTERDVETARRLGAPDDVVQTLEAGEWPSVASKDNVRYAEAAEDHLAARYGVEFQAASVSLSGGILEEPDSVALTVASGPFAGEECTCSFYSSGAPSDGDPMWADSYPYLKFHEEYETTLQSAVVSSFSDLPEGTWAYVCAMDDEDYRESAVEPDADLAEAGPYLSGHVWVYLSPDSSLSEEEYNAHVDAMVASLEGLGLRVDLSANKVTRSLEGAEFTWEWAQAAVADGDCTWTRLDAISGVR